MSDWNDKIIEDFRANEGVVGGTFDGIPLLLLHHTGAKTKTERVSPLAYQEVDGGFAVFASKSGADTNPDWLHNLRTHPETKVEVGTDTLGVKAREAEGSEYDEIWTKQTRDFPFFADYEAKTARPFIPVVVLDRV